MKVRHYSSQLMPIDEVTVVNGSLMYTDRRPQVSGVNAIFTIVSQKAIPFLSFITQSNGDIFSHTF